MPTSTMNTAGPGATQFKCWQRQRIEAWASQALALASILWRCPWPISSMPT